jgi:hypothetical protein
MSQLDDLLPEDDGCPDSAAFRRLLLIELRKTLIVRRGVALRLRAKRGQA